MANDLAAISANKECLIGDYRLLQIIGKGTFAVIRLARHLLTGTEVAVKAISHENFLEHPQELVCLKHLSHPNIVRLFEVMSTKDKVFLVMKHVSGSNLAEYLETHGAMSEEEARPVFRQLVSAVQYCHRRGSVHRDLKPRNVLLDSELNAKLVDFGFGRKVTNKKVSTFCGTYSYMAPEILQRKIYDGPKVDVWSLGVLLYRMLVGRMPFVGDMFIKLKKAIIKGQFCIPHYISMGGRRLLRKLLTLNPSSRPRLEEIMSEPWLNKGQEEELRPYFEPPLDDLDPWVIAVMKSMAFSQDEIQESLTQRKFDSVMGTYLILRTMRTKKQGRSLGVRPSPSPDTNRGASSGKEGPWSGVKSTEPSRPPSQLWSMINLHSVSLESRSAACQPCLDMKPSTARPGLEGRTSTPPLTPGSKPFTLSPALQRGLGESPTTHRSRRRRRGAPEGPNNENRLEAKQPDGETPASPSGPRQGRRGLGRRGFQFFLRFTCCGPSTHKKQMKRTKTRPM